MSLPSGQPYRRLGLAIEAICMLGMLSVMRGNTEVWGKLGIDPSIFFTFGLVIGFLLWAFGTILNLKLRRQEREQR